ncbi:MAG: hypothetical protein R6U28_01915, partial [Cyclonatronaceae bacterium]
MKHSKSTFFHTLILSVMIISSCGGNDTPRSTGAGGPGGSGGWPGAAGQATSVEVTDVSTASISDQIRSFGTIRAQDVVQV